MAASYKAPGVYIEETSGFPPRITAVETAIPAFIGYTAMAESEGQSLTGKPIRISSLLEFSRLFGERSAVEKIVVITDTAANNYAVRSVEIDGGNRFYLHDSIRLFFDNGGGPCWIVSVGTAGAEAEIRLGAADGGSMGLLTGLAAVEREAEPTMLLFPDAVNLDQAAFCHLLQAALSQCARLGDRVAVLDLQDNGANSLRDAVQHFRTGIGVDALNYGAAYAPWIYTAFKDDIDLSSLGVSILIGGTGTTNEIDLQALSSAERASVMERCGSAVRRELAKIPPSGAVAGIYARVDAALGVWKAPANQILSSVSGPVASVSEGVVAEMNIDPVDGKSINAIRRFPGKGTRIWGARTLAGNDNEWRYVNVRRFFNMVEESVRRATEQFAFQPNDANTWVKTQAMIENFLTPMWRQGAMQGTKPEHAFYVRVGLGSTMTATDILEGRMIIEIGMAIVRPAEFIMARFSQTMAQS